jgi:hypothetical protein
MGNKYTCIHTPTHAWTPAYTHAHTQANERNVQEQTPTPARPMQRNSYFHPPPPKALRQSTRHINPNPHNTHQQANLLPRVLSPLKRSIAPLSSLSHSFTSQRFSLAPTLSRLSTAFSLALGPGIGPRRTAGARRPTAATPADTIGETPLPSGPAPAKTVPFRATW